METQQDAILNLIKGKDVLISRPTALGKFIIFQSFPIIVGAFSVQVNFGHANLVFALLVIYYLLSDKTRLS